MYDNDPIPSWIYGVLIVNALATFDVLALQMERRMLMHVEYVPAVPQELRLSRIVILIWWWIALIIVQMR